MRVQFFAFIGNLHIGTAVWPAFITFTALPGTCPAFTTVLHFEPAFIRKSSFAGSNFPPSGPVTLSGPLSRSAAALYHGLATIGVYLSGYFTENFH